MIYYSSRLLSKAGREQRQQKILLQALGLGKAADPPEASEIPEAPTGVVAAAANADEVAGALEAVAGTVVAAAANEPTASPDAAGALVRTTGAGEGVVGRATVSTFTTGVSWTSKRIGETGADATGISGKPWAVVEETKAGRGPKEDKIRH